MSNFIEAINPANGESIGKFPIHTIDELKNMIEKARIAQKSWKSVPIHEKVRMIIKIRKYIIENADRISEIISIDNGKTRIDALSTEVLPAVMAISYYCKNAKRFLKPTKLNSGNLFLVNKRSKIIRVPYGVVGIISPWNYPFGIPFSVIIMSLLAGNSVVLKAASETQPVGSVLREAINSAKLPDGLFNYINIPGKKAGDAFLELGIDKMFFTGSVEVGKYLMKKAANNLTPISLELGGNDPMIVCEDADVYRSVMGAIWAGFQNAGQSCGGVERLYVHEKIYDEFMSLLFQEVSNLKVGIDIDYETDMGCMTTSKQKLSVEKHIEEALNMGAKIFAQSRIPEGESGSNFMPAMILTDVNHNMMVMKDETFGPVIGVMKYKTYDEAVELANDSYLGLSASVWTRNRKRGLQIASQIKAGSIMINDHLMCHGMAETPWGGFKESGIGRTHGKLGFDEMTQPTVIVKDILPFVKKNLWWHPFNKKIYDGIKGVLQFMYGNRFLIRLSGARNLIRIVPRIFLKN
jgi:acyl-CoA reductase-like NAD-dependent aldehyde dehydrogenase